MLASFHAARQFSSVVWSTADIATGQAYSVPVDGALVATVTAGEAAVGGMGGGRP